MKTIYETPNLDKKTQYNLMKAPDMEKMSEHVGAEILYMKSKKNLLNSLYGLMAQDPLRIPLVYSYHKNEFTGENTLEIHEKDVIPEEEYNKYINKAFLTYAWGVCVTANARRRLHDGMRILADQGAEFVYGDTDSLKYIGDVDWTELTW